MLVMSCLLVHLSAASCAPYYLAYRKRVLCWGALQRAIELTGSMYDLQACVHISYSTVPVVNLSCNLWLPTIRPAEH